MKLPVGVKANKQLSLDAYGMRLNEESVDYKQQ